MNGTGVKHVFSYLAAFAVMGFLFWILNEIVLLFKSYSETGNAYDIANFLWGGVLLVFLVLSTFWLIRKLKEWEVVR